jgi:metal-sulfur cluster biosynthetic enzyme
MVPHLIREAVRRRFLVVLMCLALAAAGVWSYTQLPVDAYPDISPQEVLIISTFPGRAPEEIERQVTIPIELAMGSVPNVASIRSRTIFGLSVVDLGLIYGVTVSPEHDVEIKMTLTAPACPAAEMLPPEVEQKAAAVPGVRSAKVEIVWEPPWDKDMMSESAKLQLGFF